MAVLLQQNAHPAVPNIPIPGQDPDTASKASGNNNSSDVPSSDQMAMDLLKDYEKTKAAMVAALLKATNGTDVPPLKGSDLEKALGDDPVWQSITNPSSTSTAASDGWKPNELGNFFLTIFTYLRDHRDQDSQAQVTQALSMLAEQATLNEVTHESTDSLNLMKHDIRKAEKKADSPLGKFLKIGLPILLGLLTIAFTIGTMGAGGGAAAGLMSTIEGAVQTAVGAAGQGIADAVEAGLSAALANTMGTVAPDAMVEIPENMVAQVTEKVTQAVSTGLKQALTSAVSGVGKEGVEEAVATAAKQFIQKATQQAFEEVLNEAGTAVQTAADNSLGTISEEVSISVSDLQTQLTTAVTNAMPQAVNAAMTPATSGLGVVANALGQVKQAVQLLPLKVVMTITALLVTGTGIAGGTAPASVNQQESSAMGNATTIQQGVSTVNSAASDALQNSIKEAMQQSDNYNQDIQATLSQLNQAISSWAATGTLGKF